VKELRTDLVVLGAGIAGLWLASEALALGRSVVVVERGGAPGGVEPPPRPPLAFPERTNEGAIAARHHVLTGNGSYWGGALVRNDDASLRDMLDLAADDPMLGMLHRAYARVESRLGAPATTRFTQTGAAGDPRVVELSVLPGRRRNVARASWEACRAHPRCVLLNPAEPAAFERTTDGLLHGLIVRDPGGAELRVIGDQFALATGVVDANLLTLEHLAPSVDAREARSGTKLHDHWSIPIATLRWRRNAGLEWLYPPTFRGGCIRGRRAELAVTLPWGRHAGFLHVQANYDAVEPYATIKRWMSARQEGHPWHQQLGFLLPLARHGTRLVRLGVSRYLGKSLYVGDGMELTAVLDFESFASEKNRIELDGSGATVYWDVRDEDVAAFRALAGQALGALLSWTGAYGLDATPLVDPGDEVSIERELRARATDAYHLGGGLAAGSDPARSLVAPDLRFHRLRNVGVVGTAAFARPGVANPVATILALCETYLAGSA
jgi:hypothetical protein